MVYAVPYPRLFSQHAGVGGHVAHVHGVVHALVACGFQVDVFAEEYHETLDGTGIDLHLVPLGSSSLWKRQVWGARFARSVGVASHARPRATFCYTRYSAGFAPWVGRMKRGLGEIPLVLELNSLGSQRFPLMRPLDRRALRVADVIVCVSERLREFVTRQLGPELEYRTTVVPNAVDPSRFEVSAADSPEDGAVHLAFAGLLKPDYGLETLLDAFVLAWRDRPHLVLHIYGDGPLREALQARIDASSAVGDGTVKLHEPVAFLDMPAVLAAMDVLVYTTTRKYVFQSPIKLLEYMAAGKPIIAAATPQVRELLGDGALGTLFEPGDVEGLAAAIARVVDNLDRVREQGRRAREAVTSAHSWQQRVQGLLRSMGIASSVSRTDGLKSFR